jgi:hypothetical protein
VENRIIQKLFFCLAPTCSNFGPGGTTGGTSCFTSGYSPRQIVDRPPQKALKAAGVAEGEKTCGNGSVAQSQFQFIQELSAIKHL